MHEIVFVFLYGLGALIGLPISVYWTGVYLRRHRSMQGRWWSDRYSLVALSFALVCAGVTITHTSRTIGNLQFGLSPILMRTEGYFIAAGLLLLLLGFFVKIRLIDLETDPPKWRMTQVALGTTAVWLTVSILIHIFWFD